MVGFDYISDGVLRLMLDLLIPEVTDDDGDLIGYDVSVWYNAIYNASKYLGLDFKSDKALNVTTFFYSLIENNPNYKTEPIKRPELIEYEAEIDEDVIIYRTVTYNTKFKSYMELDKEETQDLVDYGYKIGRAHVWTPVTL